MRRVNLQLFGIPTFKTYLNDEKKAVIKDEEPKGKQNLPSLKERQYGDDGSKAGGDKGGVEEPKVPQPTVPNVNQATINAINKPFSVSNAYMEAMNYTNSLLEKMSSGRTSYTDRINGLMNQIQNREDFSYDMNTDTMFQQYLSSMTNAGKQAMQDTMGQASALSGGYGSTYAQSVGNQTYNAYLQEAMGVLPEYYQMALDAYNAEGQEMYNQLGMLVDADATEYGRMQDAWSANYTTAQQMYQNEYNQWQAGVDNAYNNASLQLQAQNQSFNQDNVLYEREYQKALDDMASVTPFFTMSEINEMRKIYKEAGYGDEGTKAVDEYLTKIGKDNIDGEVIDDILGIKDSWSLSGLFDNIGDFVNKFIQ